MEYVQATLIHRIGNQDCVLARRDFPRGAYSENQRAIARRYGWKCGAGRRIDLHYYSSPETHGIDSQGRAFEYDREPLPTL